jgi:APA family basic amino acid/polyamine antiporter
MHLFQRKPIADLLVDETDGRSLKRVLGAGDLIMLAIGAVIGAGIFGAIGTAAMVGDAAKTYDLTNIGTLFAFALVSAGVLVLRVKEPNRTRHFKVPLVWIVAPLGVIACLFVMVGLPRQAWERFGIWLVIGAVLYASYGYRHSLLRGQAP